MHQLKRNKMSQLWLWGSLVELLVGGLLLGVTGASRWCLVGWQEGPSSPSCLGREHTRSCGGKLGSAAAMRGCLVWPCLPEATGEHFTAQLKPLNPHCCSEGGGSSQPS